MAHEPSQRFPQAQKLPLDERKLLRELKELDLLVDRLVHLIEELTQRVEDLENPP